MPSEFPRAAVDGTDKGSGHKQRGAADGRSGALAGQPPPGVLQAERRGEARGPAGHAVHGPRQGDQTLVAVQLHRPRAPATLRDPRRTLPRASGIYIIHTYTQTFSIPYICVRISRHFPRRLTFHL